MTSTDDIPFPIAPAPWHCRGEAFWLLAYVAPGKAQHPPVEAYGVTEAGTSYADPAVSGEYKGGISTIQVVRYTETPVGPYDEIIWTPGRFRVPGTKDEKVRITRIYVSSLASVFNGRRNWNIAKALASFNFHPAPKGSKIPYSRIDVASPSDPSTPFFTAHITPYRFAPSLPLTTTIFPLDLAVVDPPLPQSPQWQTDGKIGTETWLSIKPKMSGWVTPFWCKGGLEDGNYGDGKGFVKGEGIWNWGLWWQGLELDFGVPDVVDTNGEGKKTV